MSTVSRRGAALDCRGWGWRYAERTAWAVSGLDLHIEPGERVLVVGPSGGGKSTFLSGVAGILGDDDDGEAAGELLVDGAPPHPGSTGLMLQNPESQIVMPTVGDDVAFGCENLRVPRAEIWSRVRAAIAAVGLDVPLDRSTQALSGGQQQRLALAGLLAMQPALLLCDEPTANLDPSGVQDVCARVLEAADRTGATLVVVEHRVQTWLPHVDRMIVVSGGRLIADGAPRQVLDREGDALHRAGVWVPGIVVPRRRGEGSGGKLLRAENVTVGRAPERPLLMGVDAEFSAGRATALTGRNGLGKSTLSFSLSGLTPPQAGRVLAERELAGGLSAEPWRWRSRELITRIGTVFQNPEHQFVAATVLDELLAGPRAAGVETDDARRRAEELLERLGLAAFAAANPYTLSGGEQRRLSVGTMLSTRPRLLILDEPTFGQDANTWAALVSLLDEQRSAGAGIIAVTHDRLFVDTLCDVELECGRWAA